MATSTPAAYTDNQGEVWATMAEALLAEARYAAEALFATLVDPERDVVQYATWDDMKTDKVTILAAFAADP
jgi:hypothetical protein